MARRSQRRTWIGRLVFIALVFASGAALAAHGDMRNPFTVFSQLSGNQRGGERRGSFEARAATTNTNPEAPAGFQPPAGFQREERAGGGDFERTGIDDVTLRWSEFGGVLFDFWFVAATAAVVMVIGRPIGWLIKRMRPRPNRAAVI